MQTVFSILVSLFVLARCHDVPQTPIQATEPSPKRIAVIGAGAAGSSTAYHLAQYARNASIPVSITVYERHSYIGGRSTTVPVYDDENSGVNVELGASIFVQVNRILVDAVREFNLSVAGFGGSRTSEDETKEVLGVWNGEEFVFTQTLGELSWWEDWLGKGKLLWRYGMAPVRTMNLMKNITGRFFKMYDEPAFPWKNGLSQAVADSGLLGSTALTGSQFLDVKGIGELFAQEIIQASARVNYAQNLDLIHGLETMVCMATDGAMSVKDGNYKIFANMLKASSAAVRLSTDVTGIHKHTNGSYSISSTTTTSPASTKIETFDTIVLAAPYHQSGIHFTAPSAAANPIVPPDIPYVNLHVTLFASPHRLAPEAFNLAPSARTPDVILTTLQPSEQAKLGAAMNSTNVGSAGFYSISILRTANNYAFVPPRREFVYKIFSPEPISDAFLLRILGRGSASAPAPAEAAPQLTLRERLHLQARQMLVPYLPVRLVSSAPRAKAGAQAPLDEGPAGAITWLRRHTWLSYPYLPPRVTFDEHRLDAPLSSVLSSSSRDGDADADLDKDENDRDEPDGAGIWYTSGIESFISTMETSALMGKNVARLIADEWTAAVALKVDEQKEDGDARERSRQGQEQVEREL